MTRGLLIYEFAFCFAGKIIITPIAAVPYLFYGVSYVLDGIIYPYFFLQNFVLAGNVWVD